MSSSSRHLPGSTADSPDEIPPQGWWQIAKRVFDQLGKDHVQLVAAGVAFYTFLAIFPALSAMISAYGLVMTPAEVQNQVRELANILPPQARELLTGVLVNLAATSDGTLGWNLIIGIALSVWSAKKGTNALFEGLNIVYNETDTRSFFRKTGLTLTFTIGGFAATGLCLFLTVLTILLGAEINAEMEHQTAKDTTVGPDKPMGQRGAYYADTRPEG